MKFTDGYWEMRPGMIPHYAALVYETLIEEDGQAAMLTSGRLSVRVHKADDWLVEFIGNDRLLNAANQNHFLLGQLTSRQMLTSFRVGRQTLRTSGQSLRVGQSDPSCAMPGYTRLPQGVCAQRQQWPCCVPGQDGCSNLVVHHLRPGDQGCMRWVQVFPAPHGPASSKSFSSMHQGKRIPHVGQNDIQFIVHTDDDEIVFMHIQADIRFRESFMGYTPGITGGPCQQKAG
jgi:hypothetical protein